MAKAEQALDATILSYAQSMDSGPEVWKHKYLFSCMSP